MENFISYVASGETHKFPTSLSFHDYVNDDSVPRKLYIEVASDRDNKLVNGIIRRKLTEQEEKEMGEEDTFEWYRISHIEFFDYVCMKKMSMKHMSDFQGKYTIEDINKNNQ